MKKNVLVLANDLKTARKTMVGSSLCSYHDVHIELDVEEKNINVVIKSKPVDTYDVVFFRGTINNYDMAIALSNCIHQLGIPIINTALLKTTSSSKSYQYALFFHKNVPFPRTFIAYADRMLNIESTLGKKLGYPFIMKAVGARQGQDNYLIKDRVQFKSILRNYSKDMLFIAQKFIPNEFDYRIVTTGYKAVVAYKRIRSKKVDTHLNNVSQGGYREDVEISSISSLAKLAERASKLLYRELCGVDVVVDMTSQKPYILEANAAPQLQYKPVHDAVKKYFQSL